MLDVILDLKCYFYVWLNCFSCLESYLKWRSFYTNRETQISLFFSLWHSGCVWFKNFIKVSLTAWMVGTMRRLTLMGTVDKHWSLRLVWSVASFVWPLWCYLTISFLQGTAICSITGKLYTLKLGILVHKRKFTGKEHDEIIYYMYIVCWIVGMI